VLEAHASYGTSFGYDEIARACEVTPQAVRDLVQKALRRLQPRLSAERRLLAK
jgi:DNA-directed RNA polymerase specialized sigma24 family protein